MLWITSLALGTGISWLLIRGILVETLGPRVLRLRNSPAEVCKPKNILGGNDSNLFPKLGGEGERRKRQHSISLVPSQTLKALLVWMCRG